MGTVVKFEMICEDHPSSSVCEFHFDLLSIMMNNQEFNLAGDKMKHTDWGRCKVGASTKVCNVCDFNLSKLKGLLNVMISDNAF